MKGVGLVLLVLTGGGVAWLRVAALRRRAASLARARRLVLWLTARLQYTAEPVAGLLEQASQSVEFAAWPLLSAAVEHVKTMPLAAAWNTAVEQTAGELGLLSADAALLRAFGEGLGKSDLAGQQAHGELYASLLEERRQQAAGVVRDRGRVEGVMWTAGALLIALLLL